MQDGVEEILRPEDVAIISPNVVHSSHYFLECQPSEGVILDVEADEFVSILRSLNLSPPFRMYMLRFVGRLALPRVARIASDIVGEICHGAPGCDLVVNALTMEIVVEVLRSWPRHLIQKAAADVSQSYLSHWSFVRAVEYMYLGSQASFSVEQLCSYLGQDRSRFGCRFRNSTQMTPLRYFHAVLMRRACRLLLVDDSSVKEVAFELGFKNVSHFSAAFRAVVGTTPQDYKRRATKQVASE
jgi:AraC-like DNA-binding protein